jgi:hypothetical protein
VEFAKVTKLVFHLGDLKTGSTSIQTILASKGWTCESVKLFYPLAAQVSHIDLALSMTGPEPTLQAALLFAGILEAINQNPCDVAVISAEHFENVDPVCLQQLLNEGAPHLAADARFIAYVRPHADRIRSTYAERMKLGSFSGTMAEMMERMGEAHKFTYAPRFLAWRRTFGSAFELRPMVRELLFKQDVVADFMRLALGTEDFTVAEIPDPNESLSVENLSILVHLHKAMPGPGKIGTARATLSRSLSRRMNAGKFRSGTKLQMHRALAEKVLQTYAKDAARLDAAFFTGTPISDSLKDAPAKAVEKEQSLRIEDHFSEREQFLIDMWSSQLATVAKAAPEIWTKTLRDEHRSNVVGETSPPRNASTVAKASAKRRMKLKPT